MGPVGAGFELGVGLGADEPGVIDKLNHLHDAVVGRKAGELHAVVGQSLPIVVVHLIAVPVALVNGLLSVEGVGPG